MEVERNGVERSVRNNLRGRFQAHRADFPLVMINPMPDWGKSKWRSEEIHNTRIIRNAPAFVNGQLSAFAAFPECFDIINKMRGI